MFPAAAAKGSKVKFHRIANSLVADVEAPAGVEEVRFGCMENPGEVAFTPVPYYTCGGNGDGVYRRPCVVTAGKGDGRLFLRQNVTGWLFDEQAFEVVYEIPGFRGVSGETGRIYTHYYDCFNAYPAYTPEQIAARARAILQ